MVVVEGREGEGRWADSEAEVDLGSGRGTREVTKITLPPITFPFQPHSTALKLTDVSHLRPSSIEKKTCRKRECTAQNNCIRAHSALHTRTIDSIILITLRSMHHDLKLCRNDR